MCILSQSHYLNCLSNTLQYSSQCCFVLTCHMFCVSKAPSSSDKVTLPCQSNPEDCGSNSGDGTVHSSSCRGSVSRWSTLSWDASSELLSPPDTSGTVHLDSDSRLNVSSFRFLFSERELPLGLLLLGVQ